MYSLDTSKLISFPRFPGTNITPAWSPDGTQIIFSSSMQGNPELYVTDTNGGRPKRLTNANGASMSPSWNPKTGQTVAFVSDRGGTPQLYLMNSDGTSATKLDLPDKGYVIDPAWAPNGQLLAFSWRRPNDNYDIYIMDAATRQLVELTRDQGRNERPSWALAATTNRPTGRRDEMFCGTGRDLMHLTFRCPVFRLDRCCFTVVLRCRGTMYNIS